MAHLFTPLHKENGPSFAKPVTSTSELNAKSMHI